MMVVLSVMVRVGSHGSVVIDGSAGDDGGVGEWW